MTLKTGVTADENSDLRHRYTSMGLKGAFDIIFL